MEVLILSTVAEYAYDASRRRIIKKRYTGGTLVETEHVYLSTNWQTLEVRLDAGVSADQQYIWGLRYIDDLVVRDRTVTDPLDERIYAMQDVQWNVIALADASGDVVQRFSYHPYGESQVHSSTYTSSSDSYHWQYRFTSRELDLDTGLDYFRNRYWHNLVGVFITRDPLEYVDGASFYAGYFVPGGMDAWGKAKKSYDIYEMTIDEGHNENTIIAQVDIQSIFDTSKCKHKCTSADFVLCSGSIDANVEFKWSAKTNGGQHTLGEGVGKTSGNYGDFETRMIYGEKEKKMNWNGKLNENGVRLANGSTVSQTMEVGQISCSGGLLSGTVYLISGSKRDIDQYFMNYNRVEVINSLKLFEINFSFEVNNYIFPGDRYNFSSPCPGKISKDEISITENKNWWTIPRGMNPNDRKTIKEK